jgi:hypothetical protein
MIHYIKVVGFRASYYIYEIKAGNKTSIIDSEIGSFDVRITTSKVDKNAIQFE